MAGDAGEAPRAVAGDEQAVGLTRHRAGIAAAKGGGADLAAVAHLQVAGADLHAPAAPVEPRLAGW